jgi:hypothetical protein
MPATIRKKGKATKIAERILNLNIKDDTKKKTKENEVKRRLQFEDTYRVR